MDPIPYIPSVTKFFRPEPILTVRERPDRYLLIVNTNAVINKRATLEDVGITYDNRETESIINMNVQLTGVNPGTDCISSESNATIRLWPIDGETVFQFTMESLGTTKLAELAHETGMAKRFKFFIDDVHGKRIRQSDWSSSHGYSFEYREY